MNTQPRTIPSLFVASLLLLTPACGDSASTDAESAPTPAERTTATPPATAQPEQSTERAAQPAQAAPADAPTASSETEPFTIVGLTIDAPANWNTRLPSGGMRAAELAPPAPANSNLEPGAIIIYHFGPTGAGTVEDNLVRWARQVVDENNQPVTPTTETFQRNNFRYTTTAARGAYLSGMPGQPTTPQPDSMMLAAIVEGGPEGPIYIKFTGPAQVVESHRDAWRAMLQSIRPAE
ncbi:MAG: hypothetical protein VYC34_11915 [Planctomycetota bacterium]|nr:hypothetical protein [Planctomycetota bacterium]